MQAAYAALDLDTLTPLCSMIMLNANPTETWFTLAMATTLVGNLIVAESARQQGVQLSFGEYLKAGVPITLLTLIWGVLWLGWV